MSRPACLQAVSAARNRITQALRELPVAERSQSPQQASARYHLQQAMRHLIRASEAWEKPSQEAGDE